MDGQSQAQAQAIDVALHTLGWAAFQDFCSTVASIAFDQPIEMFARTRDGGRDGGFRLLARDAKHGLFAGSTTIQCKHTDNADTSLTLALLQDELTKLHRLAGRGLATNYVLMTNMKLTGTNAEAIQAAFLSVPGVKSFYCFGKEWLVSEIRKSPELRRFIPRIYGLGDLSAILDERAYLQSRVLFDSLRDEIKNFVTTEAYVMAGRALARHNFVLLLGDPGSGKSMIAATHALASLDLRKQPTLKIRSADEFMRHWNPNEPNQLFWVDDAFGATQFDEELTRGWASIARELRAAASQGATFFFTSRTYIFRAAERFFKSSDLPQIFHAQVVIHVEELTPRERQQIVYNHIKLGGQSAAFKTAIKSFLSEAVASTGFLPETARRLGDPFFTRNLSLTKEGVRDFFERPLEYLDETITRLDDRTRGALYLLFMSGGSILSPLLDNAGIGEALAMLGISAADAATALRNLDGALIYYRDSAVWSFKHPTIRDALARIVGRDAELIDIYLYGTPVSKAVTEIHCAGAYVPGSVVLLPKTRYDYFADQLATLDIQRQSIFLASRADADFIQVFAHTKPACIDGIAAFAAADPTSPAANLMGQLYEEGFVSLEQRYAFVEALGAYTIKHTSSEFIRNERLRNALLPAEVESLAHRIEEEVLRHPEYLISSMREQFNPTSDNPDDYFDDLVQVLEDYQALYDANSAPSKVIDEILEEIPTVIEELWEEMPPEPDYDDDYRGSGGSYEVTRDVFDDVDS